MFYALRRSFLSSPPDSPLTQQQRLPTTWTWPEERALQKTLCRRLVCGLWAATSVTFRKLQPCKLRNFFATYCCSCVWFSRDPRRFFGLIYCRFVSLAATLMPSLHQAVAYRFHIAKSALVPTLELWNSGAVDLWISGSRPVSAIGVLRSESSRSSSARVELAFRTGQLGLVIPAEPMGWAFGQVGSSRNEFLFHFSASSARLRASSRSALHWMCQFFAALLG